jgi:hypothetical protein
MAIMGIRSLLFGVTFSLAVNVSYAQISIEVGGVVDLEAENCSNKIDGCGMALSNANWLGGAPELDYGIKFTVTNLQLGIVRFD